MVSEASGAPHPFLKLLTRSTIDLVAGPGKLSETRKSKSPQHRRQRGSGGVFQLADGVWKVDIELPRDTVTGRRRRPSRTIRGTREEAELALSRLKTAGDQKRLPSGGTNARSVAAAMDQYLAAARSGSLELAPKTVTTSCSAAKVMSNTTLADGRRFGAIRLSRLSWEDIESLYAAMRASGRGPDWIRRCGTVLTRSLDLARKRGLIDSNPAKDAVRPKSTRKKPTSPLEDDVRAVLETVTARDPEMADMAVLLASTGMRTGEMLGLQWADVDLAAAEVYVAAAVTDGGPGVGVVRKTTKRSDWRDVPLTGAAVAALQRQNDRYRARICSVARSNHVPIRSDRRLCQANATGCSQPTMDRRPRSFPDHSPRGSALCGNRNARRRGVVSHGCGDPR